MTALPAPYKICPPWHLQDGFVQYQGDALGILQQMLDESVQCVVTSPPYFGLRDYGTGTWQGGNPDCDHDTNAPSELLTMPPGSEKQASNTGANSVTRYAQCVCGATREDLQVGLEETPEAYVERLVIIFRELRRVLRKDGVFWLNISDSYARAGGRDTNTREDRPYSESMNALGAQEAEARVREQSARPPLGFKIKDLIPVSWMLAMALQQDGWYLRAPVIWHKPNAFPTSAKDRPGLDHEYVFMLTRSPKYYFDMEAVKVPAAWDRWGKQTVPKHEGTDTAQGWVEEKSKEELQEKGQGKRNLRTVWSISTKSFRGAHFATFPPELVQTCIAASTAEGDVVLDPFMGSGTTAMVAQQMGRKAVGIDLSEKYCAMVRDRCSQDSKEQ